MSVVLDVFFFFFFNDTATTEIYTLSLHDALPICAATAKITAFAVTASRMKVTVWVSGSGWARAVIWGSPVSGRDRKSTRLNSSHSQISYAVFCLKKKKERVLNGNQRDRGRAPLFC